MSTRSDIERNLAEGKIVDIKPLRFSSRIAATSSSAPETFFAIRWWLR